ncbi:MAG: hypothetical protein PHT76_11550 [Anaerostipes sp.]|nr:hypothetical protein [Anaerostipes sp.]
MEDIALLLLKNIKKDFNHEVKGNSKISKVLKRIRDGTATYKDANDYSIEIGKALAGAYKKNISSSTLPDGRMYYNIANRVVGNTLKNNYDLISRQALKVQAALNKKAKIGLKAIRTDMNQDKAKGIINRLSSEKNYDDIAWILDEPIVNFSQSVVDDSIRANSEFQGRSGMSPKIIRKPEGKCCKWCAEVAGVYTYPDVPDNVYRRHQNCRCTVEYDPGSGKVQNVHTRTFRNRDEDDIIQKRKMIGANFKNAKMPPEELQRAINLWERYDEVPMTGNEKERIYEELDNNLSTEEKESSIVTRSIGNNRYTAINKGHNRYKIIQMVPIDKSDDVVDEVLTEMFGSNWKEWIKQ